MSGAVPLPEGHYQRVTAPSRRLGGRERGFVAVAAAAAVIVAVVVAVALLSRAAPPARGCIDLTIQGPVGGTELKRCGAEARALCAAAGARRPGTTVTSTLDTELIPACRRAGLPTAR